MSNATIDEFFNAVRCDQTLRQELEDSPSEEAFFLTAVRRGAERGFVFTVDEVRHASKNHQIPSQLAETYARRLRAGEWEDVTHWRFCTWTWLGC